MKCSRYDKQKYCEAGMAPFVDFVFEMARRMSELSPDPTEMLLLEAIVAFSGELHNNTRECWAQMSWANLSGKLISIFFPRPNWHFASDRPGVQDLRAVEEIQEIYVDALQQYIDAKLPRNLSLHQRLLGVLSELRKFCSKNVSSSPMHFAGNGEGTLHSYLLTPCEQWNLLCNQFFWELWPITKKFED